MKVETLCSSTPCDRGVAERPRYYPRQLITSDDLTLEQEYFRDKQRAHNRLLHGWGVVCGANVCPNPDPNGGYKPWEVVIGPGYILGPYGDEIVIDRPYVKDLRKSGFVTALGDVESIDPWCSQVYPPQPESGSYYIAVRYKECQARPVRVQPSGCSCEDNPCEYSRVQDGFEIAILDHCPEGQYSEPAVPNDVPGLVKYLRDMASAEGPCTKCPTEPWVVLAKATVAADGTIDDLDNCDCRRIVVSFANTALRCHVMKPTLKGLSVNHAAPGDTNVAVTLSGTNFQEEMKVNLGPRITIDYGALDRKDPQNNTYKLTLSLDADAPSGPRRLTLVNPDCTMGTFPKTFTVDAPAESLMLKTKIDFDKETLARKPAAKRAAKKKSRK